MWARTVVFCFDVMLHNFTFASFIECLECVTWSHYGVCVVSCMRRPCITFFRGKDYIAREMVKVHFSVRKKFL